MIRRRFSGLEAKLAGAAIAIAAIALPGVLADQTPAPKPDCIIQQNPQSCMACRDCTLVNGVWTCGTAVKVAQCAAPSVANCSVTGDGPGGGDESYTATCLNPS